MAKQALDITGFKQQPPNQVTNHVVPELSVIEAKYLIMLPGSIAAVNLLDRDFPIQARQRLITNHGQGKTRTLLRGRFDCLLRHLAIL